MAFTATLFTNLPITQHKDTDTIRTELQTHLPKIIESVGIIYFVELRPEVKNSCTKFRKNPKQYLVAHTRPRLKKTAAQMWSTH
jgi:hypothetical protein